jgi:hypothetical protein
LAITATVVVPLKISVSSTMGSSVVASQVKAIV